MSTFDTPTPIAVTLDLSLGTIEVVAEDRAQTEVDVRPSKDSRDADVWTADHTDVSYGDGQLTVVVPKDRARSWFRRGASIDVTLKVPVSSDLRVTADLAKIRTEGRLGAIRIVSSYDDARVAEAEQLDLSGIGSIRVGHVRGAAEVSTVKGPIDIQRIDGPATVKSVSGDVAIGEVHNSLHAGTTSGAITVDRAMANVQATTTSGRITLGEVHRGSVRLEASSGRLACGIAAGTAAWIDAHTSHGLLRNELESADGPLATDQTVEVHAQTYHGDIVISRAVTQTSN